MIREYLHLKQAFRFVFTSLLFVVLGLTQAEGQTYSYTFSPSLGSYTSCSSGTHNAKKIEDDLCKLSSSYVDYSKGVVSVKLQNMDSDGRMRFIVHKCDGGCFKYQNTGKLFIVRSTTELVYCQDFYISNSSTEELEAYFQYENFSGTRYFNVFVSGETNAGYEYYYYAGKITVTGSVTQNEPPVTPYNPNPSNGATGVSVNPTLSWSCYSPSASISYYELYVRTPDDSYSECFYVNQPSYSIPSSKTLPTGQQILWRVKAKDTNDLWTTGPQWSFTTEVQNEPPVTPYNPNPSNGATGVSVNPTLSWSCYSPSASISYYELYVRTPDDSYSECFYVNQPSYSIPSSKTLPTGQQILWRVKAKDTNDLWTTGPQWSFTTEQAGCYCDCTPSSCGDLGQQMYEAAEYLCERGIVEGNNGYLNPDSFITRAQLAKTAFYGLYGNSNNVPNLLVTDYFPSIYSDLQDPGTYYYRAAKALLYLEYGDGRSPFDRDRAVFNPTGTISRCLVLKVLLETFNIAPATGGSNPFTDYDSSEQFWGYAKKAYDLGIVQVTTFNPHQECKRGHAFLFLYRILTNNSIPKPTPNYDSNNPFSSDFFIPTNLSPAVVNAMRGVEYGNFNYYEKDFFNIPGYMNLDFGIAYNSYLTEMPNDIYPVKPLGTTAWTHTYDMYMNIVTDTYNDKSIYVFHMQDGSLLMYEMVNGSLSSKTDGNYYELTQSGSKYILKSVDQISYSFTRKSTSDGIYYLTQIKDRNNNTIDIAYEYGNDHYRITSVSTLGRTLHFYYTSNTDLLYYVKDPKNRKVYFYYTDGELTSVKDAKSQTSYFNYGILDSDKGLLKSIKLPKGNYVYNEYEQRKLVSMRRVNNSNEYTHTTVSLSPNYQSSSSTSRVITNLNGSQSVTTDYTMNEKSRITRMKSGSHTDISYEYNIPDKSDLVSKETDNKTGVQTTYDYNSKGLPISIAVSAGGSTHSTSYIYTDLNDVYKYTDARGYTTTYYYNDGNLSSIEDALSHTTNYINNSHGKPTQKTDPTGLVTNYTYNDFGNETQMSIPVVGVYFDHVYDEVSRVTSSKTSCDCQTTTYSWDDNDNMLTKVDALNNTTSYTYDANDNLTKITNAKGKVTNLDYDNNDFMTSVSFQGATKNYTYNRDGSLASYTDPNGNSFDFSYNSSGELTNDGYASYSYNSKGQLVSVTKDSKAISYSYDAFGRISTVTYNNKSVSYSYDNNDNITSITYPGNKTVAYTYNGLNQMTSVTDWNNATTYYYYRNDGQLQYYQYPNGVRTTFTYDNGSRVVSQTTKRNNGTGSVVASYSLTWDEFGNHTQEAITEPYTSYPAIPSSTTNYSYNNANRLTAAGSLSFNYDSNGNTTTRSGRTYGYDTNNNLTSVNGDFSASYTYDGLGNRRSASRNGVTRQYVLDLLGETSNVLMETDGNGNAVCYYIYGAFGLASRIDASNNTCYYVYDYRGSTVAMIDDSNAANITHKYQYDDFGKVLQSEEADTNPFRYVGRFGVMYEDNVLVFMRARYYDPEIGRFLSEDPIWSTNLYPYADNNPITGIDPKGESDVPMNFFADPAFYCAVYEYWSSAEAQHRYKDAFDLYMDRSKGINSSNSTLKNLANYFSSPVTGKLEFLKKGLKGTACGTSIKNVKNANAQWKEKQKAEEEKKKNYGISTPKPAVMY